MAAENFKTFWDIEQEKTWRIFIIFAFLVGTYFVSFLVIWFLIKFYASLRSAFVTVKTKPSFFDWGILWVLLVATGIAAIHWYHSNRVVVDRILNILGAQRPDKHDKYHYIFENVVDEIQTAAGGMQVEPYILPTGAMNAFALADLSGRKIIGVTEGLLSRLRRDELQSVIAHEMAHIVSNDCLLTTVACALFGVYEEALARVPSLSQQDSDERRQRKAVAAAVISVPVFALLFVVEMLNQLLNMFISREKEYRADAAAVRLTREPVSLASALYKIAIRWRGAGYSGDRLSPIFILSPAHNLLEESEGFFAELFSTHPPITKRLQILLDLAHAEISQLTEQLQKRTVIKTETEDKKPVPGFFANKNDAWYGPFNLMQLQALDWLEPETRLRMEGAKDIITATEVPALSYFFKVRAEPIWKIKRLCPLCRQWLVVQEYEGLYLWRCAFCSGILIEKDKIPRIITRKEKGFTEQVQRIASLVRGESKKKHPGLKILLDCAHRRKCPKCGNPMVHRLYSYAYHIEIDECQKCGLVWFDENELEVLQCLTEIEDGEK